MLIIYAAYKAVQVKSTAPCFDLARGQGNDIQYRCLYNCPGWTPALPLSLAASTIKNPKRLAFVGKSENISSSRTPGCSQTENPGQTDTRLRLVLRIVGLRALPWQLASASDARALQALNPRASEPAPGTAVRPPSPPPVPARPRASRTLWFGLRSPVPTASPLQEGVWPGDRAKVPLCCWI